MKKGLIVCILFSIFLFLISCTPISQEELQSQATAQLHNLSDAELQQLKEQSESKAIAGQGYQIPRSATVYMQNAARALNRVNRNTRTTLLQREMERRVTIIPIVLTDGASVGRGQDSPCTSDSQCVPSLKCRSDSATQRNTCQWWNIGGQCFNDSSQCAPGLVCGFNGNINSLCFPDLCASDLICELANQPAGAPCVNHQECASRNCQSPISGSYRFGTCT